LNVSEFGTTLNFYIHCVVTCCNTNLQNILNVMQLQDVSAEVAAVKASLTRVVEEGGDCDHGTPTPTPSPVPASCEEVETALLELVHAEKWAAALRHAQHNRFTLFLLGYITSPSVGEFTPQWTAYLSLFVCPSICTHITTQE
jgi:hypothetical protein